MSTSGDTSASKHDTSVSAIAAWRVSFSPWTRLDVPFSPSKWLEIGKKRILFHIKDDPIPYAANL